MTDIPHLKQASFMPGTRTGCEHPLPISIRILEHAYSFPDNVHDVTESPSHFKWPISTVSVLWWLQLLGDGQIRVTSDP